jgi:AraC-like DNA-binding protein
VASRYPQLEAEHFHICIAEASQVKRHGHDFLELSYILRGRMLHEIDGQQSQLEAGDYFIVDHGTEHSYQQISQPPLAVVNLLFYPEFLDRMLSGSRRFEDVVNSYLLRFRYDTLHSSPTGKTFHDEDGRVGQIVETLIREYEGKAQGAVEYCRCLLVELLILTMRKIGSDRDRPAVSDTVQRIMSDVKANYAQELRLSHFAREYHYSLSGLSKKFTDEVGMGFSQYLQRVRIQQSCRLLEGTDLRISEVATRVGYANVKFFNQIFKEILSTTPREYRKARK